MPTSTYWLYSTSSGIEYPLEDGCHIDYTKARDLIQPVVTMTIPFGTNNPETVIYQKIINIHQPYSVEWQESDITTMTPRPLSFVPAPSPSQCHWPNCPGSFPGFIAMVVLVPVFGTVFLCCVGCACWKQHVKRRQRRLDLAERRERAPSMHENGLPRSASRERDSVTHLAQDALIVDRGRAMEDPPPPHDFDPPPQYRTRASTVVSRNEG
jgi:hypothetical protein